jgi:hypothetical protein
MKKLCNGSIYKIGNKFFCVGEKMSKKVNGKTVTIYPKKSTKIKKSTKNKKTRKQKKNM